MAESRDLSQYLQPALSEARLNAQWARIVAREPKGLGRTLWGVPASRLALVSVAVMVMALVGGRYYSSRPTSVASSGLEISHLSNGKDQVTLSEGVAVELERDATMSVEERTNSATVLRLDRGVAQFEVTKRNGRRVVVRAPRFDVEVVGTRFVVSVAPKQSAERMQEVSVRVQRGVVKVHSRVEGSGLGQVRTLSAGESWSSGTPEALSTTAPSAAPAARVSAAIPIEEPAEKTEPQASASTVVATALPSRNAAKELFESAERHRVAGRLREAEAAFDGLRRGYPSDPRAALSAFELGRIRMDSLGDPAGALTAFRSALKLNSGASFREDAEARMVQLHERLGQDAACKAAKSAYLARYPQGSHVKAVGRACVE